MLARGPVHEAFAQPFQANPQPGPVVPKRPPDPIPEEPPDQKPQTETPSTPANSGQNSGQKQTSATQSFTGTVMKSGDTYVLKTSDNMTYQLDDQARAKDYEGKQVQITGSLDPNSNTIKVQAIKPAA